MLLAYLFRHFITEEELLQHAEVTLDELASHQKNKLMPLASYSIDTNTKCSSFFGGYQENGTLKFYPNKYVDWLIKIKSSAIDQSNAKQIFIQEYNDALSSLAQSGLVAEQLSERFDVHIEEEWKHFLSGTYGLCTVTGLAAEIAAKEVAISIIDEVTLKQTRKEIPESEQPVLLKAIKLLDQASAPFAPHERDKSSRERCINRVRALYQL